MQDLVANGSVAIKTGPFGTQLKASEYVSHGTPVLNVRNLGYATVNVDKLEMVSDETLERLSAHKLMTDDIVFGRKGAVERHAYISANENGWMQGSDCIRLRVLSDSINPRYLSYYFLTKQHKAFMMAMCSHGTTMASLNQKIIEKITFPMPDRSVQDNIVSVLATLDERIRTNQKINENLLQQAHALFAKRFVTSGITGESKPLYEFAEYINGAAFKPKECGDRGLPIIKIAELKNGITDSTRYFEGTKGDKYLIENKDILFSWSGNPDTSIDIFIWTHGKAILNQHTFNVKSYSNHRWFTFLLLKYFKPEFARIANDKQTTGLGHVTASDLKRLTFVFNKEAIESFEEEIRPIMEAVYSNQVENQQLADLRDTLLPKLMSGDLDISNVED